MKQLKDRIFISQEKYCNELLKKFDMDQCKTINTPISTSCQLEQDCAGKSVDQSKYRGLIGFLLYLTASRPDIMFVVCLCARYQSNPKESCTALVVGSNDVASSYSIGVLTRRQVGRREGSRGAREVASY